MIIHQPELLMRDGDAIVHARIEMKQSRENIPDHLWYRVPEQFSQHLSLQGDAFLIPGLLAGMHFQEDIEMRGTVSPRLAYNLEEYQELLHFLLPKPVTPVKINYSRLEPLPVNPAGMGTTFSGGVDSFYSLWKHLPGNQPIPGYQITHALFLLGFDILHENRPRYEKIQSRYRDMLREVDIELIPLETNLVRLIVPRMKFTHFYAPVLIGSAHLFGNLFSKFIVPNSNDHWQNKRWTSSSNPTSDPLLSSDTLTIIHHGASTRRVEKVDEMCDWDLFQNNLRVCTPEDPASDILNCSRCEKCVRTMIPIYALGKMEKFSTFEKPFKTDRDLLWWARKFDHTKDYVVEVFPFIRRINPRLIPWLRIASLAGYGRYWIVNLLPKPLQRWLQRYGYYVDKLNHKTAYEDPELAEFLRSREI